MKTKTYKAVSRIQKDGATYLPGDDIKLEPHQVEQLLELGAIEPAPAVVVGNPEGLDPDGRAMILQETTRKILEDSEPDLGRDGKPTCVNLAERAGLARVTAGERDAAFALVAGS